MLKLLIKKQMSEIFRNYVYNAKKNCARSKKEIILYISLFAFLIVGVIGGAFFALSMLLSGIFETPEFSWLYFTIMGLISVLLGTLGSVFNTFSSLYLPKDNDLMLSLPIPVRLLVSSRLVTVYLMGAMYSGSAILPAILVYWIRGEFSVKAVIFPLLFMVVISVFVLSLSCALGWVVAKISIKLKNKSFITVLISILFFGGYYFFYYKAQVLLRDLAENAAVYGEKVKGSAYPLYVFGRAATGDALSATIFFVVVLLLFALIIFMISRSFLKLVTSTSSTATKKYEKKAIRQKSIFSALLSREFGRFFASPIYMLNCGLGILMLPVGSIAILIKGKDLFPVLNEIFYDKTGTVPIIIFVLICAIASMNDIATPSISLEGKSLWIIQSLPIAPLQVLKAKLGVQIILTGVPLCFGLVCIGIVYPYSKLELIPLAVTAFLYVLMLALFDLTIGIKTANTTWVSELVPVKQNLGVLVAMLAGFIYAALVAVCYIFLYGWKLGVFPYMAIVSIITLAISMVLWRFIKNKGCNVLCTL